MTEKTTREGTDLAAFAQVLETFGSDRTRWPAPVRRDFAGLLATSAEAHAKVREAEALDRLLDLAPPPQIDTNALASRILAAAAAEAKPLARPAATRSWGIFDRRSARRSEDQWPAAALLAASLVLGAIFGFWGTFEPTAETAVAEASFDPDMDPAQIAFDSSEISMFEGDLL
jgi:hypothetical protein